MTNERWLMVFTILTVLGLGACSGFFREESERDDAMTKQSLYSLNTAALEGGAVALKDYDGKVALIVNVASECGFTPQYGELQELQDEYAERGLVVMGFPSWETGGAWQLWQVSPLPSAVS